MNRIIMKQIKIIFLILMVMSISINAQTISIVNRHEILSANNGSKFFPILNAMGNKLLYTSDGYNGLSMYDFNTKTITPISNEPGAGYEPIFEANDSKVFYRNTSFQSGRKFDAMESYDFAKKQKVKMLSPQRDLKQARNFHNGFIVSADRKLLKATFGRTSSPTPVYITTQDLKIILYKDQIRYELNPINEPDVRYIWVSLSPNNKMILFTAVGKGTFVSDLKGKIIAKLGKLSAPIWYNDNYVVGMQDKDDGHVVTESKIVMMTLNGKTKTQLSLHQQIAMYPTASSKSGKIAFHTLDGTLQIVEIAIK